MSTKYPRLELLALAARYPTIQELVESHPLNLLKLIHYYEKRPGHLPTLAMVINYLEHLP